MPDAFFVDVLGIQLFPKTEEIIWSVYENHDTSVKGVNKSSKTYTAAGIGHWWLSTLEDSILVTTAPSEEMVTNLYWRDFRAIHDNCAAQGKPLYDNPITQAKIDIGPKWYGIGLTARAGNEARFQGFHSRRVLYIPDEASGVDKIFLDARQRFAQGTDDRFLAVGNPYSLGEFYRFFSDSKFSKISISAFDLPNVNGIGQPIPGLLDAATVERWRQDWPEDSMLWKQRVLAEFWDEGSDGLIPLSWFEAAVLRGLEMRKAGHTGKKTLAVDVADGGESETIIGRKEGLLIHPFESFGVPDTTAIAHRCERDLGAGYELAIVDANGVGSGTASTLRHDKFPVLSYKGSLGTDETDKTGEIKFVNCRSAAHWCIREALNPANPEAIGLPDDQKLREDLVGLRYHTAAGGKIAIEEKDKVMKRLGRSPDRGDCLAMLLWGSHRKGGAARLVLAPQTRGDVLRRPQSNRKGNALAEIYG
ncbi:hypothetical protein M0R72_10785 [Candidatus Pacearchaeota archaeon]|nr:hypothetical protein [Candidatus Pacearchaeota archaeon]